MMKIISDPRLGEKYKVVPTSETVKQSKVSRFLPKEGIAQGEMSKDQLIGLINKKFPDIRSIFVEIQNLKDTGTLSNNIGIINNKLKNDTYNLIYNKDIKYEDIYHFLMSTYGPEKIDILFNILGRNFIDHSIKENKDIDKLFKCGYIISDYRNKLDGQTDPIILGMTVIGKFRDILN